MRRSTLFPATLKTQNFWSPLEQPCTEECWVIVACDLRRWNQSLLALLTGCLERSEVCVCVSVCEDVIKHEWDYVDPHSPAQVFLHLLPAASSRHRCPNMRLTGS